MPARPAIWHPIRSSSGSSVAAGPSTCGDGAVGLYHRTTGVPGQGVDGRLPCPVFSSLGAEPVARRCFAISKHTRFSNPTVNSQEAETGPERQAATPWPTRIGQSRDFSRFTALNPAADDLHARRESGTAATVPRPPKRSLSLRGRHAPAQLARRLAKIPRWPAGSPRGATGRRYGRAAAFVSSRPTDVARPEIAGRSANHPFTMAKNPAAISAK